MRSAPACQRRLPVFGAGIVARLPMCVGGVALVLGVGGSYGSYAFAGICAGTTVAVAAVAGPQLARGMRRAGQRPVLLATALGNSLAWLTIAALCLGHAPRPLLVAACALAGATATDIGATVRARWSAVLDDDSSIRAAYLLESFADEAAFVAGPLLVTSVGATAPALAPAVVAAGPLLGWTTLACLRSTMRGHHDQGTVVGRGARSRARRALAPLIATFVVLGTFLATLEVLVVALTDAAGSPQQAGAALAGWAAGSALAALVAARWLRHVATRRMLLAGVTLMAAAVLVLPASGDPVFTVVVFTVAGLGAAPAIGAGYGMAAASTAGALRTEAMAWMSTALAAGTTVGAALAGAVADRVGGPEAYLLCSACGLAVLVVTAVTGRRPRP